MGHELAGTLRQQAGCDIASLQDKLFYCCTASKYTRGNVKWRGPRPYGFLIISTCNSLFFSMSRGSTPFSSSHFPRHS